jgi:hypothetical protein
MPFARLAGAHLVSREASGTGMPGQIARNHHLVPQWHQRCFLADGGSKFWVLDKTPLTAVTGPDRKVRKVAPKALRRSGTKVLFQQEDFYTVQHTQVAPDEVESWDWRFPIPGKTPLH